MTTGTALSLGGGTSFNIGNSNTVGPGWAAGNANGMVGTNLSNGINGGRLWLFGHHNTIAGAISSSRYYAIGGENTVGAAGGGIRSYLGAFGAANTITATTNAWAFGKGLSVSANDSVKIGPSNASAVTINQASVTVPLALIVAGDVTATNLPTADPQIPGRLWNDAGAVKVSAGP